MTGVSISFIDAVVALTIPSLQSLVQSQYGDDWTSEWPTIQGWWYSWGVTVVLASNGECYFIPGMSHDMSDLESDEVALIYGPSSI
jgi:hypothetical protein